MTLYIEQTNNPLIILACMAVMFLQAVLGVFIRAALQFVEFVVEHHRIMLACIAIVALPIVALLAVNAIAPILAVVLPKLLVASGLIALFAVVTKPKGA